MRELTNELILKFKNYLIEEEKSKATLEKYIRDIETFYSWVGDKELNKLCVLNYKEYLTENYAVASVNSMLSSINSFFAYPVLRPSDVRAICGFYAPAPA